METNRRRGQSFFEDEDDGSKTGAAGTSPSSAPGADCFTSEFGEAPAASSSDSGDTHNSDSTHSLTTRSSSEEDLEEEEKAFSRGRSRSRSICGTPDVPEGGGIIKYDPSAPSSSAPKREGSELGALQSSAPKSGPLAQREIQVLKKGLEEAVLTRPKDLLREEEERLAAATEKRDRVEQKSSVPSYTQGSESHNVKRWKILMLGDSGVGKSSLIMRWTADTFSSSLVGTVGVNFKSKKVTVGEDTMQVQVWDTAGQEQFHKITTR